MQKQINTFVADFSVRGPLAYLSHQETLTLFERAFVRSGLPMAYTQGFNPHPVISIPLPRSVGVESDVERVCVKIEVPDGSLPETISISDLNRQLPKGCEILETIVYPRKKAFTVKKVQYVFQLASNDIQEHIQACQKQLLAGQAILVERCLVKKRKKKVVDISQFLERLDIQDGQISVLCRVMQEGTVRIDEMMHWLGLCREQLAAPVKRVQIEWNTTL